MAINLHESATHRIDGRLPVTYGPLTQFPDDPLGCMRRLKDEHGSIAALEDQGQRVLFVFHPDYNQRVLCDNKVFHSRFFAIRGPRRSSHRRLSSGLLTMNGEEHKQHRRMVMQPFQKSTLPVYHEVIQQQTTDILESWKTRAAGPRGLTVDINAEMTHFMLRLTCALIFGVDDREMAWHVGEQIDKWVGMNNDVGIAAFVPDLNLTRKYDELLAHAEQLEVDVRRLIDARRPHAHEGKDVLSLLIQAHEQQGAITEDELIGHVALMFGAAHLTTAHTFTWTLFLLAQHPSVMRRAVEEARAEMSGDATALDDFARMPFTERIIRESMRLMPASCYLHRTTVEPTELGPFQLNVGTPVVFSQFMTHHLPDLYPDPEAFLPDRWLTTKPTPYGYLPFGNGPRMCLGAGMAWMILQTALPMMLKRYRMTAVANSTVHAKMIATMLGPTTPVPMHIVPQDGRFQSVPVHGNIHSMMDLREMPGIAIPEKRKAA